MKFYLLFFAIFLTANSVSGIEISDKKNILNKLDEKIGDFNFERSFAMSSAEGYPRYLELSCLKLLKSTWCRQKDVEMFTKYVEDYESLPIIKYSYKFFVNSKEKANILEEEYTQNNRNLLRLITNTFLPKNLEDLKKRLPKYLVYDENQGCLDDKIEITSFSEYSELNKKMMKVSAKLKVCSPSAGVATFDMLFLFGPGNSLVSRLKEFTIGFDNIGYYRLIKTSGL